MTSQALKIAKPDTGDFYYLSYRRGIGFDSNLSASLYLDRLSVHTYKGDNSSSKTYLLSLPADGESYSDAENGILMTTISHNDDYLTVEVTFDGSATPTCNRAAPLVNVSPSSQTADAGANLQYSVTVTNQDSDACESSGFELTSNIPTGWTGDVVPGSMSLAPGQAGSATLSVASAESAAPATYDIGVTAADNTVVDHQATGAAEYTVTASCTPDGPSMSIAPGSQNGDPGAMLSYVVSLTNNDSAGCPSSTFDLRLGARPAGWPVQLSNQALELAAGQTGSVNLSVESLVTAAPGSYSVWVSAATAQPFIRVVPASVDYIVNEATSEGDVEPPTAPTALSAKANSRRVNLSWAASSDNVGVAGYRVYRDGILIGTVADTAFGDAGGTSGVIYAYSITAFDSANNTSAMSAAVMAAKGKTGRAATQ